MAENTRKPRPARQDVRPGGPVRRRKKKTKKKNRPVLRYALVSIGVLALLGAGGGWLYLQSLYRGIPELPATETLWAKGREQAIEFVDQSGTTVAIRGPRYGRAVSVADLPPHVPQAFIAAEDKRFYQHDGADTQAILRAIWANLTSGRTVSGASTITQQLIKNLVLTPEQTLKRKAQEVRLARELERRLTKDQILDLYLNRVYFGSGFYGLGAAARFYFGKTPEELSLAEASLLATLPQAPSRLALNVNMGDARERQQYVLEEMVANGFITQSQADAAAASNVTLTDPPERHPQIGYTLDAATAQLDQLLPSLPGDLVVHLTIDADIQNQIDDAITAKMAEEGPDLDAGQAAAIVMDARGRVLALYGGVDYTTNQFNRAIQASRQPGSSFKAFVYAAALERGISPYETRRDRPIRIGDWQPRNYSGRYSGTVTLVEALKDSLNTVAAQLAQEAGTDTVVSLARRFGITTSLESVPSIALGSSEVTLWDLTRSYGVFMTGGRRIDPYLVDKIETSRGEVLYQRPEYDAQQVYPEDLADTMAAMLSNVVSDGTGRRAAIADWQVAGKTGTSQDWRDAWFAGFSAELVGAVWVGNDDDTAMNRVTGGGLPAELWGEMMTIAHQGRDPKPLPGANAIVRISPETQARISFYRELNQAFASTARN